MIGSALRLVRGFVDVRSWIAPAGTRAMRDQLVCLATAVVLLAGIFALQPFLTSQRAALVCEPPSSMRGLAVTFPRLTLGGFRGLLATRLWITAEQDKQDHKWLQLETDYNYIGTLEPYFSTVYNYNAWNEAYNLSAQWHTDAEKYTWVLDGLLHLYEGEEYNPNDPDLIVEEGHMFFLKLGGAYERIFYRKHWRYDIANLYELADKTRTAEETAEVRKIASVVLRKTNSKDEDGEFHTRLLDGGHGIEISGVPDPKNPAKNLALADPNDSTRTIKDPIPFRYGVSPFYFAYCEYVRCLAQPNPPTTIGLGVLQSYPAMSLRLWCRDDVYYSADTMRHMFLNQDPQTDEFSPSGKPPPPDEFDARVNDMRDCYRNVGMIAPVAVDMFNVYIAEKTQENTYIGFNAEGTHRKHVFETQFLEQLGKAELKMMEGLVRYTLDNRTSNNHDQWVDKPKVSPEAAACFRECRGLYADALAGMQKYADKTYPPIKTGNAARPEIPNPDFADFKKYEDAVNARIDGANALISLEPGKKPDFMFLQGEVVEK